MDGIPEYVNHYSTSTVIGYLSLIY